MLNDLKVVDRIEGQKAILIYDNGKEEILGLKSLPKNIKEGDILDNDNNILKKERKKREENILKLLNKLKNK